MTTKQSILIVDDRKENLVAMRQALEGVDAEIVEARSGNEALAAALDRRFAVAILDVMMPGMGGYELAEHLRGDDKTKVIPIVFVTASYADEQHMFEGYEAGGIDYIVKPFDPRVLLAKVRVFLELDRSREELRRHHDNLETLVGVRTAQLEHLNVVLSSIRDVNQLIVREKSRDRLIRGTCESLVRTRGFQGAWIVLNDRLPDGVDSAQVGFGEAEFKALVDRIREGRLPRCCRQNAADEAPTATRDPAASCELCPLAKAYRGNTALTVALRHANREFGCLGVSVPPAYADDEQEASLLAEIAGDIAFALHGIEMESERRKSEETLRAIFESASDGVLLADAESGRFVRGNNAICRMLGYSAEEIARLSVGDVHRAEDLDSVRAQFQKQARGEMALAVDMPMKRKDGTVFLADVNSAPLEIDGRRHLTGIFRDITERKRAEDALWHSHELLRAVLDNIPARVFWKDRNLNYLGCNLAFARDAGFEKAEDLVGKDDFAMGWREQAERYRGDDSKVIEDGEPRLLVEEPQTTPSGETIHLLTSKVPLRDAQGAVIGVLGTYMDITPVKQAEDERHRLEAQLRQSQKLESIGTLAGGVAHEINNPIMGIMNYAQLILDRLGPDSPVAEFATEIGKETERVATIVKNLLSFARIDKQSHSPARMCDIVEQTLSLMGAVLCHDQIALDVNVPEDLPKIKCRSQQIQQVLMNLITNARDALNEKYPGHDADKLVRINAEVETRNAEGFERGTANAERGSEETVPNSVLPSSEFRVPRSVSRFLRLTVEDHGTGIPEALRARIFDPFFTTKPCDKGTGLGLSISHSIAKDHGGQLTVESAVGQWTRFHLDLPVEEGTTLDA